MRRGRSEENTAALELEKEPPLLHLLLTAPGSNVLEDWGPDSTKVFTLIIHLLFMELVFQCLLIAVKRKLA